MSDDLKDVLSALLKVSASWGAVAWSWLTLNHVVSLMAIVYTGLQAYVLWRDKIARHKDKSGPA